MKRIAIILSALLACACASQPQVTKGLRHVNPAEVGMDARKLDQIDSVVNANIEQGTVPGAVVAIVRDDKIAFLRAYGNKSVVPDTVAMTTETMFDLASLSKCVGTTLSFMQLIEQGFVRLSDNVDRYIPGFAPWVNPKTGESVDITIQDLLTHASGISAYISVPPYLERFGQNSPDSLMSYIAREIPRHFEPGTDCIYSCLNFITLQNILQRITGQRLCDYAQKNVFDALGLEHTTYFPLFGAPQSNPRAAELAKLCAPTEVQEDGKPLVAEVHDPTARLVNGGNSGNAGVFSNAEDMAVIAAAILNGGEINGRRILGSESVRMMMTIPKDNDPCVARAIGWDTYDMYPGTSGDIFPREHMIGHTGYTGTSMIIEPDTRTAVIILAHRVHPVDEGSNARMRATIANIAAASIID